MICISPRAPRGDLACALPALSTSITTRIRSSGIANRRDASVTNGEYGATGKEVGATASGATVAVSAPALTGNAIVSQTASKYSPACRLHLPSMCKAAQGDGRRRHARRHALALLAMTGGTFAIDQHSLLLGP